MSAAQIQTTPAKLSLPFAVPPDGSERIAQYFRQGILRYLVPTSVALALCYHVVEFSFGRQPSALAFMLLAMCGVSFALSKLNRVSAAVATFTIGTYFTLLLYCLPVFGQDSGLATGAAYTFSMFPLMVWLCYANRTKRIVAIALTLAAVVSLVYAGQSTNGEWMMPQHLFVLSGVRVTFVICITIGFVRVVDVSVAGFSARNKEALRLQEELNLELANRQRDLEREARSHRQTLEHLSRSETRFRHLFDHAFDGIILFDGDAGRPLEMNTAFVDRLGYSRPELETGRVLDFSPATQADGRPSRVVRREIVERLDAGESMTYPWLHSTKAGGVVDFDITTFTLPEEGNIRVSIFRDMTEARLAEQKLTAANRELRTFAHAASHDLKEPLRTMSNFAKLIDRRYKDLLDDAGREYLGFIMDAAQRGTTLVQDLLEYAELGTQLSDLEVVNLQQTALAVRHTVDARLQEAGAELHIDSLPEVVATQTWARQLLQNLVSNALKFQRPGVKPVVRISAKSDVFGHEIRVADNGIGIAPEDVERVFGVFERLVKREDYEGNGIGLALCRRIMQKVEGDIRLESTVGEGTTFILWFPNHGLITGPSHVELAQQAVKQ